MSRPKKATHVYFFIFMRLVSIIIFSIIFSIVLMVGCLEEQQQNKYNLKTEDASTTLTEQSNSVADIQMQIDCLEKLFNNDNYLIVNNTDSSFLYFTRLNPRSIFTHSYKLFYGDSTQLTIDTIQANDDHKIVWKWKENYYYLDSVSNNTARWVNMNDKTTYEFNKNNEGILFLTYNKKQQFKLIKTPQISLFLIRSWNDYKNGTHYAFNTSNFTKKH